MHLADVLRDRSDRSDPSDRSDSSSRSDPSARSRSNLLAAVALLSFAGVAIIYLVAVRTRVGQRIDDVAFNRRSVVTAATTQATDRLLGTVSVASLFVVGGAIVLVGVARRRVVLAIGCGFAMSAAVLTTEALKLSVLGRPQFGVIGVSGNSYPSGHATIGMVLSLGLVMVAPLRLRRMALFAAAVGSAAFGTAVLSSGWHRPSDTIGAYLVSLGWFATMSVVVIQYEHRRGAARPLEPNPPTSRPLLAVAATLAFGLLMFVLWRSVSASGLRTVVWGSPYIAACVMIDVVGILVVGMFYVLDRTSASAAI
ncbi:MAG: phosphatase PAP2 family protein [Ilumatobacteraceae bacterium]